MNGPVQAPARRMIAGAIESGVEFHQVSSTVRFQFEPVHLTRPQYENGMVLNIVRSKVYFMGARSLLQSENEKEIVPVQFVHEVVSSEQFPDIPYAEAF